MFINQYKKQLIIFSMIFLFSFFWIFSLTYNFPLFWEDSSIVEGYKFYVNHQEEFSYSALFSRFVGMFITPEQFYGVAYMARPLGDIFLSPFVAAILGFNPIKLRFVKALAVSGLLTLYFAFFYFICKRSQEHRSSFFKSFIGEYSIMPFLLWGYVLVLPEVWIMALYFIDTLTYTLFFSTVAIMIFYFFYNNDNIQNKLFLFVLFLLIVFFTDLAILMQHVGRINFFLFFVFIILTDCKKLLQFRYWSLILVLFSLSIPILGTSGIFSGKSIFDVIGVRSHMGVGEENVFETLWVFITSIHLTFLPQAFFIFLLFFLFAGLHLYALFFKEKNVNYETGISCKPLVIFSFFWFILNAGMIFAARTFAFDPKYFLRFEFTLFLFSQVLFLISYCIYVRKKYFSQNKIIHYVIIIFLMLSVFHNVYRLNEWRGGWGAYFLGYDTARQYVDEHAEHAVLLLPWDHGSPIYFSPISTNTHAMVKDLTNASIIKSYAVNHSAVYVASKSKLVFYDVAIVNTANLTIIDNSPYGLIKKAVGKYYQNPFYMYQLKDKNNADKP